MPLRGPGGTPVWLNPKFRPPSTGHCLLSRTFHVTRLEFRAGGSLREDGVELCLPTGFLLFHRLLARSPSWWNPRPPWSPRHSRAFAPCPLQTEPRPFRP
jgi:hypothetical protein